MRIIFSRKGFDSAAGGCPSPIIDGRPVSLPIPTRMPSALRYADLTGDYGDLVEDLTRGRIKRTASCHLDPDLNANVLVRLENWRGCLGQVAAAQSHLANNCVAKGDLFLFWGLFRPVLRQERWTYSGSREHRIFGWLQIGDIIDLGCDGSHVLRDRPWLRDHPHARDGWCQRNALYIASEQLILDGQKTSLPGWGTFRKGHRLSAGDASPSLWTVPDWLNPQRGGVGMTYHPPERWDADGGLQSAARGQEFIAEPAGSREALAWLRTLFQEAA